MNWEIFERIYNGHWFLVGYSSKNFSELLREGGSKDITTFIGVMENDVHPMIFDKEQFNKAAHYYSDKLINDHAWRRKMYKRHDKAMSSYFNATERLRKLPFSKMKDKQIVAEIKKIILLQEKVRIVGVILNGLILDGRNHLSNKIQGELKEFIGDDKKFEKYWPFLSQVTKLSLRQEKDIEIAKLAVLANKLSQEQIKKKLKKIYEKYYWLDYMYYGPPATFESFEADLKDAIKNNKYLKLKEELQVLAEKQRRLMTKLKFNRRVRHLVWLAKHVLWQKGWRKDVEYHGFYCYEPWLREVAKRKGEKDWRNLLFLLPWEAERFILYTRPNLKTLRERRKFSCLIVTGPKNVKLIIGKKAHDFYKKLDVDKDLSYLKETKGQCAYEGKTKGKVKLVYVPEDMKKMNKGDILVSQATSPDLISAMKKAAAIVTNTGGLICHAAIISRELKIPCVVGTHNATLIFKDGDNVEVDATKGIVKKL